MLYSITKKGKTKVGWRARIRPIPDLSLPEGDVLRYLLKRKTPATSKEIHRGVLKGYTAGYVLMILGDLRRSGLVKKG